MNDAASIWNDVERMASLANAYVVRSAIISSDIFCPTCQYPQNHAIFHVMLNKYKRYRRYLSQRNPPYGRYCVPIGRNEISWPCPECIKKYNPTHRNMYEGKRLPEYNVPTPKELLV